MSSSLRVHEQQDYKNIKYSDLSITIRVSMKL